ncbi:MAG: tRNA (guanosine(46)-N7)-methyltransferase TrmB [Clostridia bacterium]|nr:tRNA (guanosine(46)-N7)-methyltransferase TrmB [Clostridia bacterium]
MRVRKKKHTDSRIEAQSRFLAPAAEKIKEDINAPFGRKAPVRLEIGCGKGGFIVGESQRLPGSDFYALELISDVIVTALEKYASEERENDNVRFIIANAKELREYFPEKSLSAIYVNFCDPWPKAGHAKRRLVHRDFIKMYSELLTDDGVLRFKTDNAPLFEFALEELEAMGKTPSFVTRDLHSTEMQKDNVMTEYEQKFSSQGVKICMLEVALNSSAVKE